MSGSEKAERDILNIRAYWQEEHYWDTISGLDRAFVVECCGREIRLEHEVDRQPKRRERPSKRFSFERWSSGWSLRLGPVYCYSYGGDTLSVRWGAYEAKLEPMSNPVESWRWSTGPQSEYTGWDRITKFDKKA